MKTIDLPFKATLTKRAKHAKDSDTWMVSVDGFVTTYRKGVGLREGFTLPFGNLTLEDDAKFHDPRTSRTVDPTCAEVLSALASDAQSYLNARDVDDFAAEYGYDKVSEALKAWRGCREAAKFFQSRKLNPEDFQED